MFEMRPNLSAAKLRNCSRVSAVADNKKRLAALSVRIMAATNGSSRP